MVEYEILLTAPRGAGFLNEKRESFLGEYIDISAKRKAKQMRKRAEEVESELEEGVSRLMQKYSFSYRSVYDAGYFRFEAESDSDAQGKARQFASELSDLLGLGVGFLFIEQKPFRNS